jgi:Flp pilus assembly protein TadD
MMSPVPRHAALLLVSSFLLAGCSHLAPHERNAGADPDARLDALLARLAAARGDGEDGSGALAQRDEQEVILDSGYLRAQIERLALEFPAHERTQFACAVLAREYDEAAKSEQYLERVLSIDPSHGDAIALRGRMLLEAGNVALARRVLDDGRDLVPDHPEIREARAAIHMLDSDFEAARRELAAARSLGAPAGRVEYHLGLLAERDGDVASAADHYRRSLAAQPPFAAAGPRLRGLAALP